MRVRGRALQGLPSGPRIMPGGSLLVDASLWLDVAMAGSRSVSTRVEQVEVQTELQLSSDERGSAVGSSQALWADTESWSTIQTDLVVSSEHDLKIWWRGH